MTLRCQNWTTPSADISSTTYSSINSSTELILRWDHQKKSPSVSQNWANFAFFFFFKQKKAESSDRHKKHTYIGKNQCIKSRFSRLFSTGGHIQNIYTKKEELMLLLWALKISFLCLLSFSSHLSEYLFFFKKSLLLRARIKTSSKQKTKISKWNKNGIKATLPKIYIKESKM